MSVLKIGFAMGGGIALGTFNGAVLGETIKLAILRGKDRSGNLFDKVEVDVFSGASAGSLSLGMMLRSLVHQTDEQLQDAEARLLEQFGDEFRTFGHPEKKKDLIAAQVLQDLQYEAWVEDISMDRLLDRRKQGPAKDKLISTAGLLNRVAVDDLAQKLFIPEQHVLEGDEAFPRRRILADRVLYASALANMTPIINDAREELPTTTGGGPVLSDGMTSLTHRELRVFDLYFKAYDADYYRQNEDEHPRRWVRYHVGEPIDGVVGNLRAPDAKPWSKMAATAISSGAFPFAFEPVVLRRQEYEYGNVWPPELKELGQTYADFTYIDGGTFNNEPIREAFRMAAFVDAHDERTDAERWVVFVDPNVAELSTTFKVPVHQRYNLEDPQFGNLDGYDLDPRHSLDRLIPQAMNIIGALSNQSRLIEGDKVYQVTKKFRMRDELRPMIKSSLKQNPSNDELRGLKDKIEATLKSNREKMMIPPGALTVAGELKRIIREVESIGLEVGGVTGFLSALEGDDDVVARDQWYEALSYILLDLTLNLSGKNASAKLISIGPVSNPGQTAGGPDYVHLPGGRLGAFGGFMFEDARRVDTEIGKWCALKYLNAADLLVSDGAADAPIPALSAAEDKEYDRALERGVEQVVNRLFGVISQGHVPFLSNIPKPLLSVFLKSKLMKSALGPDSGEQYEFRIKVPKDQAGKFEFDGPGTIWGDQDIPPMEVDGEHYLITYVSYKNGVWSGPHISGPCLKIDRNGFIDREFCLITLPTANQVQAVGSMGYPAFYYDLCAEDKGKTIQSDQWYSVNHAKPLFKKFCR